ncbi:hypothetical protein [Chryseobacterium sp. JM1]|uniref:hypothetical protein n=1 Tax=Chryseobacterium sp. JM1 TaxID=1233950 RepID=UPI0004E61AD5|nr:hypothetical protein [Chryseobacterium sp. JM1]KFF15519.1 hypothetical protein IW22_24290 [Chryseobacterium sp. JM1]
MSKFFFIIYMFFAGLSIHAQNFENKFQVSFQDSFQKDTVSLRIGKCEVINNKVLISREIGFTGVRVELHELNKIIVFENGNTILEKKCSFNLSKDLKFYFILNKKKSSLDINLNNGKYIGLSKNKKEGEAFILQQLKRPFEYD